MEELVGSLVGGLGTARGMWIHPRVSHTQFLRFLRRLSAACGLQYLGNGSLVGATQE